MPGLPVMRVKKLEQIEYITALVGAMILVVYWLIVATLPDFFFINPTGEQSQLRRAELILSTIGWILMSTVAPLALFLYASGYKAARRILPITALVWPISLIISQITVYILDGTFYLDYLAKFPIFIFTDFVLPVFIIMIWIDLREPSREQRLEEATQ